METALFYAFSTIAQTLAGAIGLLAAFLLYYLTQLDKSLRDHLTELISYCTFGSQTVDLAFMWEHYDVPGLLAYFEEDRFDFLKSGHGLAPDLHLTPAKKLWQARRLALRATQTALLWTGVTIIFALTVLASARVIAPHVWLSTALLASGIAAVAWCFWLYSRLILVVARP